MPHTAWAPKGACPAAKTWLTCTICMYQVSPPEPTLTAVMSLSLLDCLCAWLLYHCSACVGRSRRSEVDLAWDCLGHRVFWGADVEDGKQAYVSPVHAEDLSELPPALIFTAGKDMLMDEAEAYAAKLASAG